MLVPAVEEFHLCHAEVHLEGPEACHFLFWSTERETLIQKRKRSLSWLIRDEQREGHQVPDELLTDDTVLSLAGFASDCQREDMQAHFLIAS